MDSMGDQGIQSHGLNLINLKWKQRCKRHQREQADHMTVESEKFCGFKVRTRVQNPHSRPAMVVCTMIQANV